MNHVEKTLALVGSCFALDFIESIDDIKIQILDRPMLPDNIDT
jgi:hypothetical protein